MTSLALNHTEWPFNAISPFREMGAYEALWSQKAKSFKYFADLFRKDPNFQLSSIIDRLESEKYANEVNQICAIMG